MFKKTNSNGKPQELNPLPKLFAGYAYEAKHSVLVFKYTIQTLRIPYLPEVIQVVSQMESWAFHWSSCLAKHCCHSEVLQKLVEQSLKESLLAQQEASAIKTPIT